MSVVHSATHSFEQYKINLPPPIELHYDVSSKKNDLHITGTALVRWYYNKNIYKINTEIRVMIVGKILETISEGDIVNFGLVPSRFMEKRFRRKSEIIIFNRQYNNFNCTDSDIRCLFHNIKQDRTSIIWQLVSVARGNFSKFVNGSTWMFLVAYSNYVEQWCFTIIGQEKIIINSKECVVIHLLYSTASKNPGWKLDIWLAPSIEWYPVRLRFTYPNGNTVEQILNNIIKYSY